MITDEGKQFVVSSSGQTIFGLIDSPEIKSAGILPGWIGLQVGYPGPKGFGARHVESNVDRMKAIRGLGFQSFAQFCEKIASSYTRVGQGEHGRLVLVLSHNGYEVWLVVEHKPAAIEPFWTIVTGVVSRRARFKLLCEIMRTSGSEPTLNVAKRTRFETLSLPKK